MQVRGLLVAIVVFGLLAGRRVLVGQAEVRRRGQGSERRPAKLVTFRKKTMRKMEIHRRDAAPVVIERDNANSGRCARPKRGAWIRMRRAVLRRHTTPGFIRSCRG